MANFEISTTQMELIKRYGAMKSTFNTRET